MAVSKKFGRFLLAAAFTTILAVAIILFVVFRKDKTMPSAIHGVSIRSSNTVSHLARAGDFISLRFSVTGTDRPLNPSVVISGQAAEVGPGGEGNRFIATAELDKSVPEGNIEFSIELLDRKGRLLSGSYTTSDGTGVVFDSTSPKLAQLSVITNNQRYPSIVSPGGRITATLQADEPLGEPPAIRIAGSLPNTIERLDPRRFRAEVVVSDNISAGPIPYTIEYKDRAGNVGSVSSGSLDSPELIYDPTPPIISDVSIASTNKLDRMVASPDDTIVLRFSVNEPLPQLPSVRIAGKPVSDIVEVEPGLFKAITAAPDGISGRTIPFTIYAQDHAGHPARVSTRTTDGSSVVYKSAEAARATAIRDVVAMAIPNESLGYVPDTLSFRPHIPDSGTMDLTIHFEVSVVRTTPREEDVRYVRTPPVSPEEETAPVLVEDPVLLEKKPEEVEEELEVDSAETLQDDEPAETPAPVEQAEEPRVAIDPVIEEEPVETVVETVEPVEEEEPVETVEETVETVIEEEPVETVAETVETVIEEEPVETVEETVEPVIEEEPVETVAETVETVIEEEPVETVEETVEPVIEEEPVETVEETVEPVIEVEPVVEQVEEQPILEQAIAEEPVDYIVITSPDDESLYGSYVEVTGRVHDPENVVSLEYEISPLVFLGQQSAFLSGDAGTSDDGLFVFSFETDELSGSQQILITAVYESGARKEARLAIFEGEGDIPTFAVVPGEDHALLTWDPHPLAAAYSATFVNITVDSGEETEKKGITSPARIAGLEMGRKYRFQLTGYSADGKFVGSSSAIDIVALSAETLRPVVEGEYKRIKVSWPEIAGADTFILEKAINNETVFEPVSSPINNSVYFDSDVLYGKTYLYRVRPEGSEINSEPVSGLTLAFPEERTRVAASWKDITVSGATVFGNYTFVAAKESGLVIFDISNPDSPVTVGSAATNFAMDVAVMDGYAYVADRERGLKVIDIDNPRQPVEVGARKTSDAQALVLRRRGDDDLIAVIADGEFGIKLIDASNPNNPERLSTIATNDANDLALILKNGRAYAIVADGGGGVLFIDIDSAEIVGGISTSDARGVAVKDDLLYVADSKDGLIIIDISVLESPTILSRYEVESAIDVAIAEDYAYLASGSEGLRIFDVSSPKLPVFYDGVGIEDVRAVAVKGSRIFAGGDSGFHLLDAFSKGESYEIAAVETDGKAYEVSLSENRSGKSFAFVADRKGGLKIFDITVPDSLAESSLVAHVPTEYCRDALAVGDYVYIADGPGGIKIADISALYGNSSAPEVPIISEWGTDGNSRSLAYSDGLLYVADGNRGIKVLDVSSPTRPTEAAVLRTEYATNITVTEGIIYLADGDGGFRIYDADPDILALLSVVDTANTRGVDVENGIAYVVGSAGLTIVDVSDPGNPKEIGSYRTGYAEEVTVEGQLAFVAEGFNGLTIVDVGNPVEPYIVSRSDNKYTVGVAVAGKYAYLVDTTGLKIVEILIPTWALRD